MTIMSISTLLKDLNDDGITLLLEGENLLIRGGKECLSETAITAIKCHKDEIKQYLSYGLGRRIGRAPAQEHYPISHSQQRLWVLDQLIDQKGIYNVGIHFEIAFLDLSALKKAIQSLVERHEILRTAFVQVDGEPRQKICTSESVDCSVTTILVSATEDENIEKVVEKEFLRPINLKRLPFRASIIHRTDGSFLFLITVHHIAIDGWSMPILKRDLIDFYTHYKDGTSLSLPDLPIQFRDYTLWQAERLRLNHLQEEKGYWLKKLSGEMNGLNLPLDHIRGEKQSFLGGNYCFYVDKSSAAGLEMHGRKENVTVFMMWLGLIKVLLHRYSQQEEIIVGTIMSCRNHVELENQIGYFSNTLALRTNVKSSDTFMGLMEKVKETVLEAFRYQEYPFDLLVDELGIARDITRNPIFDVMVSFEEVDSLPPSTFTEGIVSDQGLTKFDLTFSLTRYKDGTILVDINYSTDLFGQGKIRRMANHLKTILHSVLEDATRSILSMPLMTVLETKELLSKFNGPVERVSAGITIADLIEKQITKTPDEVCLISNHGTITFRSLNEKANQLAHWLRNTYGIFPGDAVGILMDSTFDRMISVLAVIKIGAAYVPMDPSFPEERNQYIATATGARLVLVNNQDNRPHQFETLAFLPAKWAGETIENPIRTGNEFGVFTILFTSGSTGIPKGVPISHGGLINRMKWLYETYHFTINDIIYLKTPFIFDVSIGEQFMPLCYGARILVEDSDSTQQIVNNIKTHGVTYIHFSPTLLNRFLNNYDPSEDQLRSLRFCFCSGEALLPDTVDKFHKTIRRPLINLYGPTEASIEASVYETKRGDSIIPIGKPIPNVRLYILDNNRELMPIGVPGEIGIGGVGIASGYLNAPLLTAERFIDDVFLEESGHRIYRTGDIGKWNELGEIEFLGRIDNQVSINGNRIELGEIENALMEFPTVSESVVVVKKDDQGNNHLIAYCKRRLASPTETPSQNNGLSQLTLIEQLYEVTDIDSSKSLWSLVSEGMEKNPDRIAIIVNDQAFSFGYLLELVDKCASNLVNNFFISSQDRVTLIMERSEKLIVALLGILKAGATYVMIDHENPPSRIAALVADVRPVMILSDHRLAIHDFRELLFTDLMEKKENEPFLQRSVSSDCYICYTSGTQGEPKGVIVGSEAVVHYVEYFKRYFSVSPSDVVLQQCSVGFDTFVEEVFPTLATGAQLVIIPEGGRDIQSIMDAVNRHQVSIISTTPLVISEINRRCQELIFPPRLIISGGDVLKASYVDGLLPITNLFNTYGPTETTVCCSYAKVEALDSVALIGRPIGDCAIYVLNDSMNPVAIGEKGEMYVGGKGVAKGYFNKEHETSLRFLSNPFGEGLLYRTGDLGVWKRNGFLEFQGRCDDQVKINGYRIDPREIDSVLEQHTRIRDAYTVPKKNSHGNDILETFFTANSPVELTELRLFLSARLPRHMLPSLIRLVPEFKLNQNGKIDRASLPFHEEATELIDEGLELKTFLRGKLPPSMIPSYVQYIDEMPLTATGKIDRRALVDKFSFSDMRRKKKTPRTSTEWVMVAIWEDVLRTKIVSIDDNFFELGGNSIKATMMMMRIYRELKVNLTLKDIFNFPTISEISERVNTLQLLETLNG